MMKSHSSVYITAKNGREARKIAHHLLQKKLIACANFFPIQSMYLWKGVIEKSKEYAILCKTTSGNVARVIAETKKIHTYEIPCMVSWKIEDAHPPFLRWIDDETTGMKKHRKV